MYGILIHAPQRLRVVLVGPCCDAREEQGQRITYADGLALPPHHEHNWLWPISKTVTALSSAGLRIERLRELPVDVRQRLGRGRVGKRAGELVLSVDLVEHADQRVNLNKTECAAWSQEMGHHAGQGGS